MKATFEKTRVATRAWLALVLSAIVGMQFGLVEAFALRHGGFLISSKALLSLTLGHALVALVVALPVAALMLAWRDTQPAARRRLLTALPPLGALLVMAGITLNVRDTRATLHPVSLLLDLILLVAVVFLGWLFVRRPLETRAVEVSLVALLVGDLGLAYGTVRSPPENLVEAVNSDAGVAAEGAPNILMVLVDTLRPDHLGCYGYGRATSSKLDALASQGTIFQRAYSVSNWTRPVVASLLSSTMPSRHGVTSLERGMPPSVPLLSESLRPLGYTSAFFTVGGNVSPEDGYDRGVDVFYAARSVGALERTPVFRFLGRLLPSLGDRIKARTDSTLPGNITDRVLAWADQREDERPAFIYVHYMGPHLPYDPAPPYDLAFSDLPPQEHLLNPPHCAAGEDALSPADREQMIAQYDGEIYMHDDQVGRLLDGLRDEGMLDDAVVLFISDHGEAFGSHGVWNHGWSLFEEVSRVPMVLWSTQSWNRPQVLDVPVSLLDVAPTILELAGGVPPESWDGQSLLPWILDERQDVDRIVFQENPLSGERGLRDAEWAYFEAQSGGVLQQWLYAAADRLQDEELSTRYPELVEKFHRLVNERTALDRDRGATPSTVELDPERLEKLRALGYVE